MTLKINLLPDVVISGWLVRMQLVSSLSAFRGKPHHIFMSYAEEGGEGKKNESQLTIAFFA